MLSNSKEMSVLLLSFAFQSAPPPSESFILHQRAMWPVPGERAVEQKACFSSQSNRTIQDSSEILIGACSDFCTWVVKEWPPKHFLPLHRQHWLPHPMSSHLFKLPTREHRIFSSSVSMVPLAVFGVSRDFHTYVISWRKKSLHFLISQNITQHFVRSRDCLMYSNWGVFLVTFLSHRDTGIISKTTLAKETWSEMVSCRECQPWERETVNLIKDQLLWGQVQELSAV